MARQISRAPGNCPDCGCPNSHHEMPGRWCATCDTDSRCLTPVPEDDLATVRAGEQAARDDTATAAGYSFTVAYRLLRQRGPR